jgi:hypothetical protein
MKKIQISLFISILMSLLAVSLVAAQTSQLTLSMSRDWGYGGFHGDIQGLFTMKIKGPSDLAKVTFYIDSTVIGEVDQAPFNLQFTTDNYPLGLHDLYAVGTSNSGQEYRSNVIKAEFVLPSSVGKTIFPVLAVIIVVVVLSAVIPLLSARKAKNVPLGSERNYGAAGGTICPRCQRPFALTLFSPHVGFQKLAVCPYCKKFSLVRPLPLEQLRLAEKMELDGQQQVPLAEESEVEKLKKEIDNSKYQGF